MLEYEKKVLLTPKEYSVLIQTMCKKSPVTVQTNYYFDTDDFSMNKKGITCRIRCKDGEFKTTVKSHSCDKTDCSVENVVNVQNEFDAETFSIMGLCLQGSLVTERTRLHKDKFCEAVLDRNMYLGHIDYELEVEYFFGCEERAVRLLYRTAEELLLHKCIVGIDDFLNRVGASKSKSERFFEFKIK